MGELFPGNLVVKILCPCLHLKQSMWRLANVVIGQEVLYLREILRDFFVPQLQPTCIYEDNLACIAMFENPVRRKYEATLISADISSGNWSLVVFFASLLFVLTSCLLML